MSEVQQGDVSAWNQAYAYMNSLNNICLALDDASMNKDYIQKYELLRRLYTKLHPLMTAKDKELQDTLLLKCEQCYRWILEMRRKGKKVINKEIIDFFDMWEIELMDLMHKKVPFVPSKSDPAFAMMAGSY